MHKTSELHVESVANNSLVFSLQSSLVLIKKQVILI